LTAYGDAANMAAFSRGFAVRHAMIESFMPASRAGSRLRGRAGQSVIVLARIALACAALSLSGCGWRLQGTSQLSPTMALTYVVAEDRYTDFNRALQERLRASGAQLAAKAGDATAVVRIIKDQSGQRVLSVSARNTPEEYEVFYAVEYSVASHGTELIPPQRLELTRDYSYDTTAVLAKQREQAMLRGALAQDLAALVLRRLASL
jgi:LPS-assembly lipoprotein